MNKNTYIQVFKNLPLFFYSCFFLWAFTSNQSFAQCGTTTIVGTGTTTWVAPAGTTSVTIEAWGGGGGGGSGTGSRGAGGGGGGAYASSTVAVTAGTTYTVIIGAGGATDANGGPSSFGMTTVVAAGGGKGTLSGSASVAQGHGPGGTVAASTGTIRYAGGNGGGASNNDGGGGGGAGGSAGTGGNGGDGCSCTSGPGGTWGEGGTVGSGRGGRGGSDTPDSVALCGFSPGGGGGGAEDESGDFGAVGGSGQVILTYTSAACPSGVTIIYSGASQTFMTSVSSKTICSGTSVNIPLRSTAGSKFTWIAAANANVTGESTTVQTSTTINNTLTNTTSAVQTVTYTVIPVPTCNNTGVAQVLNVTVNPLPTMTSTNVATICSGATVSIPLTSTTDATTLTTFTWIAANNANTTGESTTSQPTSTLSNTIVNSAATNQTVVYTVTPSNSCGTGTPQTVNVLVKTPPILSSSLTPAAVCSGTTFAYTATSTFSSPTFAWTRATVAGISNGASSGTGNVSETLINTTAASVNVTYVYTTTSGGCSGSPQNVVVSVKPAPTLSSSLTPPAICSGTTFSYQATSSTLGATFAWSRATVANITEAGTSGSSNPVSETLTNTTGVAINVTYVYTTTANSCSSIENVVVSVKGSAKLSSSLTPPEICSGATFGYTATSATSGATFAWSRAAIAGISEALSSGTGNVSETLTNTTASAINVTYVYVTTANSCSNTENVVVSVKPVAQLSSSLTGAVCSGSTFGYTATSASSPVTFAWSRAGVAGINAAAAGSGTGNISEVLSITSGTAAIDATYAYTTTLNGCTGATQNVVVTVNPIPVLSSTQSPSAICSGTTFGYTATSATAGATFAWTRAAVAGISEAASSGTGNVSETLTNTTTAAIDVVYLYLTTAASCGNSAQSVTVSVKPLPILNSTLTPAAICSGATFGYTATSATGGGAATFSWSRATVTGITEAGNSGSSNPISQVLTNTTSSAINVTYVYTTTFASCTGASQSVVVSVKPLPQGTFYGNTICDVGGDVAQLTFSSTSGTGPFDLAYNDPTPAPQTKTGAVTNTPFNAIPNQTVAGTYVYTLTSITDANGCVRTASITTPSATITVTTGTITADPATPASSTTCAGATATFAVSATGVTTWSWQVNTTGANGGTYDVIGTWTTITGSETGPTYNGYTSATLVVTNTTTSHDGYRYRAYMLPGCGTDNVYSSVAKMTINTLPVLTSSLAPTPATCSGSAVVYTPTSGTAGATFAWTRAAVTGITTAAPSSGTGAITTHTLTNTTVNPINVTYAYVTTNTVTTCSSVAENVVVTINPSPVLSSSTGTVASMCSPAAFTYTPESETVGSTFAWTRATIAGITEAGTTGTAGISETLTNTSTAAIDVTYTYTTTANSCSGPPEDVVVTVNPAPTLSSTTAPTAVCTAVTNFDYDATSATAGATFTWTRATVAGITEAGTSGTNDIVDATLTNTTDSPINVTYVYTATAGGCSGSPVNVVVSVKPVPVLGTSLTQSVCSGTSNTYSAASSTSGSTFAWTRATVTDITPVGTTGTGSATETFTNNTDAPIDVIYVYTTTAGGCAGPAQNVVLTVNPIPELSSDLTPSAVCSETAIAFGYTPTSAVSGATYAWTRAAIASINANASGSSTGNVSEVLTNTSTAAVNVTYVYTTTANGCSGAPENVVVSIKPRPVLSSASTANLCSGATLSYTATSATAGSTFAWTRAAVTGISQAAASGTADISEVLTNTTIASIAVDYIYTTTADGCASATTNTVTVTVKPKPTMVSAAVATICTGTSLATIPSLTFASDIASDFAWTRANTANIGPAGPTSGSSNPVSEVLTNATADALSTTYVVTPTSNPGACAGIAQNVVVTVTPVPEQANAINANPN